MAIPFHAAFEDLTGHRPFGWQQRLFEQIVRGEAPEACDIPTGLGKTSIIPTWLIALGAQSEKTDRRGEVTLPRRLVYVVDRRTVVDQATEDAEMIRRRLREASPASAAYAVAEALKILCVDVADPVSPLAISTLRGEFADNREWQADPGRAAIIVGTVDMIGSRLLFSGYGAGRSSRRALSAGLLGHDALLVHDEAHLSQPFGELVKKIAQVQEKGDTGTGKRALRVLEMSATRRAEEEPEEKADARKVFALSEDEKCDPHVARRFDARKALHVETVEDADVAREKIVGAALRHGEQDAGARVLVFCQKVEDAKVVFGAVEKQVGAERAALLIGPLRGRERDKLVVGRVFQAFKAAQDRQVPPESLYLVANSAGEVGVDLDADHMVCDLSTLDSMIQRLGRVNRLGRQDENFVAQIDVFDAPSGKSKDGDSARAAKLEAARARAKEALRKLPLLDHGGHDASPRALRNCVDDMRPDERAAAFAPEPSIVPLTDILLDNWALTSVRDLPGRPPVDDWLHGKESEPPETTVVWREEAAEIAAALEEKRLSAEDAAKWFDDHRIEPQERLRETTQRAGKAFEAIATRAKKGGQSLRAIVLKSGSATAVSIDGLSDKETIANTIVVLPAHAGGLKDGMLDGTQPTANDVADVQRGNTKIASDREPPSRRWRARLTKQDGVWSVESVGELDRRVIPGLERFNGEQSDQRSIEQVIPRLARCVRDAQPTKTLLDMSFVEKGRVLLAPEDEPDAVFLVLISFAPARSPETALDRAEAALGKQELEPHLLAAERYAVLIAKKLALEPEIAEVVRIAVRYHDLGKHRRPWQRAIGNNDYPRVVLAKSDHRRFNNDLCKNYRHEFGSLIEARRCEEIRGLPTWQRELVLHLIASHHGWARPHFKLSLDDPKADGDEIAAALADAPRFHARMQRRFGRWGLVWLEALVKAADVMATTRITPDDETTASPGGAVPETEQAAPQGAPA